MHAPVSLAGISAPDSAYTRKAADIVARVHNRDMLNHVHRSWWFADFLGRKRGLKYDREVVYLAALMHDLGLTEAFQAALAEVVRKKPILAAGTGLVDIGHRHVPGFSLPNGCDLLDHTVFETRT